METLALIKPWTLLVLSLTWVAVAPAYAQNAGPTPAQRLLASQFEASAAASTDLLNLAGDAALERARIALDQANALDPTGAQRWWMAAQVSRRLMDPAGEKQALRHYVKLYGSDDVAQLRLIELFAADKQTLDERIALCGKFVEGPSARKFSAPLRSRLALQAALMHMEQGRIDEYQRLVALALQLDPANQAAAAESFRAVADNPKSTTQQKAAALFTLFHANPTDPATHVGIGDTLMEFGLYAQAYEWFTSASMLTRSKGQRTDLPMMHSAVMSMWGSGQVDQAMQLLNAVDRPKPIEGADADAANGQTTPTADPHGPPVETLMLKAAIISTAAESEGLDELYARIEKRLLSRKTEQVGPEELTNLVWARLLFNKATGSVAPVIERIEKIDGPQPVLRGWLAARNGKLDEARQLLAPLAESDPRAALGLTLGRTLDAADTEGLALLQRVATAAPYDLFGLIAVSKLRAAGVTPQVPADAQQLSRLFAQVPPQLQHIYSQTGQFVQLRLKTDKMRFGPGEPIELLLELRNVSDIPLSLGPDGSINGQVYIMPRAVLGGATQPMNLPGFVVDTHRQIRLAPRRSLYLPIRLDTRDSGVNYLLAANPEDRVQLDLLAILNPVPTRYGSVTPGLLGASAQVRNLARRPTPISPEAIDAALAQVNSPDAVASMRAVALLVPLVPQLRDNEELEPLAQRITDTVNAAFAGLDPIRQAWVLSLVGTPFVNDEKYNPRQTYEPIFTAAADSDSELVQLALLAFSKFVSEPDDPLLTAAMRGDNPRLKRYAEATRTVLERVKEQQAAAEAAAKAAEAPGDAPETPAPPADLDFLK